MGADSPQTPPPMRFAYADPPYLGCCKLYDHHHEAVCGYDPEDFDLFCWDNPQAHHILINWLTDEFPDGWALSATSVSLRTLLPMCVPSVRVAGWFKSFSVFKKGVRPAYAWEPVIYYGGRNPSNGYKHAPPEKGGKQNTPKDFFEVHEPNGIVSPITLRKGLTGAKPEAVCRWILDLLNFQAGDEMVDVFPGTGVMGRVAADV